MIYIPYTAQAWKDGVCLFERDCELRVEYSLPDGPSGSVDWDVVEFHFEDRELTRRTYVKICRHEPLFHVLYKDLDIEWIDATLRDMLADEGIVDRYAGNGV